MTETKPYFDRILWAGRFASKRIYPDDELLALYERQTGEDEMSEVILAEIVRRGLDV